MPTLNNEMMRAIIIDHYSNPQNKHGPVGEGYEKVHMHSDNCIDDIDVFVKFENDVVKDACFNGVGCAISTASTDILCNLLIGKTKEEVKVLIEQFMHMMHEEEYDEDMLDEANAFANTSKQAARIRCATIGYRALEEILKEGK